ncbi:hypothetical protein [Halococcus sp. PRR34]|uniref:hypothetical protein n=1 Tax=Halococcus sp. PRR34 TaxID=3020830 RepID=UPI002360C080|nr:hypothetical protein [Halococcus sp. PRR34]
MGCWLGNYLRFEHRNIDEELPKKTSSDRSHVVFVLVGAVALKQRFELGRELLTRMGSSGFIGAFSAKVRVITLKLCGLSPTDWLDDTDLGKSEEVSSSGFRCPLGSVGNDGNESGFAQRECDLVDAFFDRFPSSHRSRS